MRLSNLDKFNQWKDNVPEQDVKQLIGPCGTKLHREDLCAEIGIGRTSFKGKPNQANIDALLEYEDALRNLGILLPLKVKTTVTSKSNATTPSVSDDSSKEISKLKAEIQKLTNENMGLKAKLRKLDELSQTVAEMGLLKHAED